MNVDRGRAAERRQHEELPGLEAGVGRLRTSVGVRLQPDLASRGLGAHRRCALRARSRSARRAAGARRACASTCTAAKPTATAPVAPTRYGNSHARRLKPLSIGAPSISSLPYFAMNAWMISSWRLALVDQRRELAAHLVRRAARILAALGDRRVAAAPQVQTISCCICFSNGVARVERRLRVSASPRHAALRRQRRPPSSTSTSSSATRRRRRFGRQLRQRERERALRQQRDAGAERHDAEAEPDPVHQRVDDDLQRHRLRRRGRSRRARRRDPRPSVRRIATSVVGSCSCLRKHHLRRIQRVDLLAVDEHRRCTPSTICFWPSSVTFTPSLRDACSAPIVVSSPELQQHLLVALAARCRRSRGRSARCRRGRCSRRSGACCGRPGRRAP